MKLRNKKTGEIKEIIEILVDDKSAIRTVRDINSLAELNEEWEDAPEEPKSYWFINTACYDRIIHTYGEPYEMQIETGNHFETREEAERAYKKLKAWKFGGEE